MGAVVSIRATRAGRDMLAICRAAPAWSVSIRATRAGRDPTLAPRMIFERWFLSARPVRAATRHEGRANAQGTVSIRATRAGRDEVASVHLAEVGSFYPRDPCGPRHP